MSTRPRRICSQCNELAASFPARDSSGRFSGWICIECNGTRVHAEVDAVIAEWNRRAGQKQAAR